jgi:predicted PurR-regulated permease PerM
VLAETLKKIWANIYLRVLFTALGSYLALFVLRTTQIAWASFLVAFIIAYLVEPSVQRLERHFIPRWLSTATIMVLIILFFVVSTVLFVEILTQFSTLPTIIVSLLDNLPAQVENLGIPWLELLLNENAPTLPTFIQEQRTTITLWLQGQTRTLLSDVGVFLAGLSQGIVILFLTAFMVSSFSLVQQSIYRLFPHRVRPLIQDLATKLDTSMGGYIRAQLLRGLIVGLVFWLTFLVIGVPKAAALAFISGLLNPIPYLGNIVATVPAVLSALTVSWQAAIITLVACILIQILDGNVLQSVMFSQSLSLQPVTVLIALLVGGALAGFWGLVLAIPLAAFLQLLYSDYYLGSKWYLGKVAESPS